MGSDTALLAKLHGRMGKYLRGDQLEAMLDASTVDAVFALVRPIIIPDAEDFHSIDACEQELEKWRIRRTRELMRFMSEKERAFFRRFERAPELRELKRYLRVLSRGDVLEQSNFVAHSMYQVELKLEVDPSLRIPPYIETLRDLPYYRILEPAAEGGEDAIDFDILDLNLDRWYFHTLLQAAKDLPRAVQSGARALLGSMIDMKNLKRIFHAKKFAPEEETYLGLHLIEGGHVVRGRVLERLLSGDLQALNRWVRSSPYHRLFEQELASVAAFMPIIEEQIIYGLCRKLMRTTHSGLLAAMAFSELLSLRVKDIRRILESKEIGLEREKIRPYMTEVDTTQKE